MTARTHNVPAQVTTLGKRWANVGTEALVATERLEDLIARYPLHGLRGPVGTQQDLLELLGGDAQAVDRLERRIADDLGFARVLGSAGQVYPRSLDLGVVAALVGAAAPLGNLALSVRLMAGHELVTEGFAEGQVGSSAMPHKMNTRSSERIKRSGDHPSRTPDDGIAIGRATSGTKATSAVQWSGAWSFPTPSSHSTGHSETAFSILDGFGVFPGRVAAELDEYLPFLATTRLLAAAVAAGAGREQAHDRIGAHATAAALALREGTARPQ